MKPAVVIGTHTTGLGVIRSLGIMHVPIIAIYYDRRDMGYASKYVKESIFAPHPEKYEKQFIDLLLGIAPRYPESLLISTSDEALVAVSKNKTTLENFFTIACADWQIIQKIVEKKYTYQLAKEIGISYPKTYLPNTKKEVVDIGNSIGFPCLIKPSQSHLYFSIFKKKMVKVFDSMQLVQAYLQASDVGLEVFVQEYIPGDDTHTVNYNSYFWNGQPLVEFTAQQIRKAPPEIGSPCVVLSKKIPEVMEFGRSFLKALEYNGYSCAEFKLDPRDHVYKLVEVNGRHNLSTLLAVYCNVNFPWLQYQHLILGYLPEVQDFDIGRYWIDDTRDIFTSIRYRKPLRPISRFIEPYTHPHIFAILDLRDPLPYVLRFWNMLKTMNSRLRYWTDSKVN